MLSKAMVYPTLPVVDINRAKIFYKEKMGLKVVMEDGMGITFQTDQGCGLYLYKRGATKADHTVAGFTVDNIESEVSNLKSKGVKFEDYDIPVMKLKTVNGIASWSDGTKGAWFKDTEGNILGLTELSPSAKKTMKQMMK